jgi:Undecaprenyl-phosphate glucose phosphotransferase
MSSLHTDARTAEAIAEAAKNLSRAAFSHFNRLRTLRSVLTIAVGLEFIGVTAVSFLAVVFYHSIVLGVDLKSAYLTKYFWSGLALSVNVLFLSLAFRHFSAFQTRSLSMVLAHALGTVALAFSLLLSTMFLLKLTDEYSRGSFVFQFIGVSFVVLGGRAALFLRIRSAIRNGHLEARRIILVGNHDRCAEIAERLKPSGIQATQIFTPETGYDVVDHENEERQSRLLVDACRLSNIQDILIQADFRHWVETVDLINLLSELPVGLHIIPSDSDAFFSTSRILDFGSITTIQVARPPLTIVDRALKRGFDICAAISGLVLLAPLFVMTAIAVKLDSRGPVFFRQQRYGYNKQAITIFKFRSMHVMEDNGEFIKQAQKNDPRITRLGRVLRSTNIDELPQLINVLTGEMSIVGPRPHATAHDKLFEELIPPYSRRHRVKPGLSGWAQVNGYRGETDTVEKMQRRIEYDLHYIENWSLWFDVKIVWLTLFSKKTYLNAY